LDDHGAGEPVARVEGLLGEVETLEDPVAREKATEMVQALLDLYGEGLARVLAQLGEAEVVTLADDELVSHLLLLHGLHPVSQEDRVRGALESVRPYLESHGGDVELLAVEEGVARLRLHGSCSGCPSSTMTLKLAIEDAIQKAAPDVESVEAEGVSEPAPTPGPVLLQLEVSDSLGGGEWETVGGLPELKASPTVMKEVAGTPLLFAGLDDNLYAYRDKCPGCEGSLEGAELDIGDLTCPGCGRQYDVRRAGRCLDEPQISLEPVPLLTDDAGIAKVALPAGVG
jgi:Fe-S cluster biogenesis protein NfuA/nitrite reductase/ring-hydroxylating ferredoxin subunit